MRRTLGLWMLVSLVGACAPAAPSQIQYDPPPVPIVTAVTPSAGSTEGGTVVKVEGTGMDGPIVMVAIGGSLTRASRVDGALWVQTPAHGAGVVDVIVNTNGQTSTLRSGYTFASPGSFDFNGDWSGGASTEDEVVSPGGVSITVQGNVLTSFSCGTAGPQDLSPAPTIVEGKFAYSADGMTVSGRLLSASTATGQVDMPACRGMYWWATKRQ